MHIGPEYEGTLTIERIKLDSGGYCPAGMYFGIGDPLFKVMNYEGDYGHVRAHTITEAKANFPKARFVRDGSKLKPTPVWCPECQTKHGVNESHRSKLRVRTGISRDDIKRAAGVKLTEAETEAFFDMFNHKRR